MSRRHGGRSGGQKTRCWATCDNGTAVTDSRSISSIGPPRFRRFQGDFPTTGSAERLRSGGTPGLPGHSGDVGTLFRREVSGTCSTTLRAAEFAEGNGVGIFLAGHG